jgi:hypothetical protein
MGHDWEMPSLGKTVGVSIKGARLTARGGSRVGRFLGRRVRGARERGGAGEIGMTRLLDLHALSCAGDTLVTMGLAGTIFFGVAADAARGRVAMYLLITMAPFALIAPIVGPILDRFRHGRRYALAATMLGRAFLAWLISDYIHGIGLYPAAFGVLLLSRAYGVARSAAVPRLLPASLGLSEAGARASVFGTVAGALVIPIGALAFKFGPQWPLRVSTVIFVIGMVIALRLPGRADSDPPETVPAIFHRPSPSGRERGGSRKVLSGRLVFATLAGTATLRGLFGYLTLFLAFALRAKHIPLSVLGGKVGEAAAIGLVAGGLGVGSFLATAVGTRMRIHRPALLQAGALALVAVLGLLAAAQFDLGTVTLLCLGAAIASGLAKLALDATIQERIPEQVRASAFAHSETVLMLAWVGGGAIGLVPFSGRLGIALAAGLLVITAVRGVLIAGTLRKQRLRGVSSGDAPAVPNDQEPPTVPLRNRARKLRIRRSAAPRQRPEPERPERPEHTGESATEVITTQVISRPPDDADESPGYHLYRPSGRPMTADEDDE